MQRRSRFLVYIFVSKSLFGCWVRLLSIWVIGFIFHPGRKVSLTRCIYLSRDVSGSNRLYLFVFSSTSFTSFFNKRPKNERRLTRIFIFLVLRSVLHKFNFYTWPITEARMMVAGRQSTKSTTRVIKNNRADYCIFTHTLQSCKFRSDLLNAGWDECQRLEK